MYRTRHQDRFLRPGGTASSVAHIADCGNTLHALPRLAGERSGTSGRDQRHVAGVEVGPKGGNNPRSAICRLRGINVEGSVLLDDPTIVADYRLLVGTVEHRDCQARGCWECQSDGCNSIVGRTPTRALCSLTVLGAVGEGVSTCGRYGGVECARGIDRERQT